MIVLAAVSCLAAMPAVNVYVENGSEYRGEIQSNDGNNLILNDEEVIIRIPVHLVKTVLDEGKDITKDILGKTVEQSGVDEHFIGLNDWFVSFEAISSRGSSPVQLARPVAVLDKNPAGNQAFTTYQDGEQVTVPYYYKTVLAERRKLKQGLQVIYFKALENGIYRAPLNEEESHSGEWMMGKLTDTANLELGYVTVSGSADVAVDNLRTIESGK